MFCSNCKFKQNCTKCSICGILSIYTHCDCGHHHDNLASKSHCKLCNKYVDRNHFSCQYCGCFPSKRVHCDICNKCVLHTYSHCDKCNRCHNIDSCIKLRIKKDADDIIKCKLCNKKHFTIYDVYCSKCNACFYQNHFHCCMCDTPIKKRINVTEIRIKSFLEDKYKYIEHQKMFPWSGKLRFDFYLPTLKTLIEFDGIQHFQRISNWDHDTIMKNDEFKNIESAKHGYSLIRLKYIDVETNNWKHLLPPPPQNFDMLIETPIDDQLQEFNSSDNKEMLYKNALALIQYLKK